MTETSGRPMTAAVGAGASPIRLICGVFPASGRPVLRALIELPGGLRVDADLHHARREGWRIILPDGVQMPGALRRAVLAELRRVAEGA